MTEEQLLDELVRLFDQKFAHLDFWWLRPKWKKIQMRDTARIVLHSVSDYLNQSEILKEPIKQNDH